MSTHFLTGVVFGSLIIYTYIHIDNLKMKEEIYKKEFFSKTRELEIRIDNLEDFKLRFYQIYSIRDQHPWDGEDSDEDDEI